jgi:hypothetical protein
MAQPFFRGGDKPRPPPLVRPGIAAALPIDPDDVPARAQFARQRQQQLQRRCAAAARGRAVVTVEPVVVERDGARFLRIPAEAGYGLNEERLENVMG